MTSCSSHGLQGKVTRGISWMRGEVPFQLQSRVTSLVSKKKGFFDLGEDDLLHRADGLLS